MQVIHIFRFWFTLVPLYIEIAKHKYYFLYFLGRYEWPPSNYKHVYFNSTSSTLKIWFLIVLGVLAFYESLRYIIPLIWHRSIRLPMLVLFLTSIYPHYYGWWGLFNYLNEGYYSQWYHQLFFSITEVFSTAMVIHLCNRANKSESWKLLFIISINTMHIIIGSLDQFILNIIYREGQVFEAVRDFGLMIPDLFHVLLSYFELSILAESRGVAVYRLFYREEIMLFLMMITLFSLLGKNM